MNKLIRLLNLPGGTAAPAWVPLLVALVLTPLLVLPMANESFLLPKATLLAVCAVLALTGWLAMAVRGEKVLLRFEPINGLVLAWTLWHWISVLWAEAPSLALESATRTTVYTVLFFALQGVVGGYRTALARILQGWLVVSALIAVLVIVQDFRIAFLPSTINVRAVLGDWRDGLSAVFFGNTSHLGDALVLGFIGWLAALVLTRSARNRWIAVAALTVHAAALIVTWSVHSNVSLVIAAAALAWLLRDRLAVLLRQQRKPLAVLVVAWGAVVAFHVVDHPLNPHGSAVWSREPGQSGGIFAQAFASPRWTAGLETRKAIWLTTLDMARERPWLGAGAGTFTWVYPETISPLVTNDPQLAPYSGLWTNAAHNEVLETWSELGIVGVFLLIAMVGASLYRSWQRLATFPSIGARIILTAGMAALIAQCLQAQMNFPLRLPWSTLQFYFLLGLPVLLPRSAAEPYQLDVPVERPIGPLQLGILMRNMAYPIELSGRFELPPPIRAAALTGLALVAVGGIWVAVTPLRADVLYREARELRLRAEAGGMVAPGAIESASRRVLAVWPGHVDCRSGLQEELLRSEKFTEVVAETPLVLEKLNAIEVRLRRAQALVALGRDQESIPDWREAVRRSPQLRAVVPASVSGSIPAVAK